MPSSMISADLLKIISPESVKKPKPLPPIKSLFMLK